MAKATLSDATRLIPALLAAGYLAAAMRQTPRAAQLPYRMVGQAATANGRQFLFRNTAGIPESIVISAQLTRAGWQLTARGVNSTSPRCEQLLAGIETQMRAHLLDNPEEAGNG